MSHIFISYSHKDTTYVEKLEKKLIREGFDVWVDHRIDYGSRWTKEIEKAIDTCNAYIVVMSKNSSESQWVERERIHAERRRKPFFPLLLDGEGWFSLGNIQFVDVQGGKLPPKDYYEDIARLVKRKENPAAIGAGVGEPVTPLKKDIRLWVGGAVLLGLLVLIGVVLKNIFREPDTDLGGTPMYATPIDQDSFANTVEPTTEPTPTQDPNIPPVDAQLGDMWTRPTDGMIMSYIPAGEFQMGSEDGDADEKPVHTVYLDGFWIDQTEVTNAMYAACVETGRCEYPASREYLDNLVYAKHPVVYVSWENARNYCEIAGGRLPTEAEWEKAARGVDERSYPWGEEIDCDRANYSRCVDDTLAVGEYESGVSIYQVYDMSGNAWEWVADLYDLTYYSTSPSSNPVGAEAGYMRILRGGSWGYSNYHARSSYRYDVLKTFSSNAVGFRCARSASK